MDLYRANCRGAEKGSKYSSIKEWMKLNENIILSAPVGDKISESQFDARRLVSYLPSHIQRTPMG